MILRMKSVLEQLLEVLQLKLYSTLLFLLSMDSRVRHRLIFKAKIVNNDRSIDWSKYIQDYLGFQCIHIYVIRPLKSIFDLELSKGSVWKLHPTVFFLTITTKTDFTWVLKCDKVGCNTLLPNIIRHMYIVEFFMVFLTSGESKVYLRDAMREKNEYAKN